MDQPDRIKTTFGNFAGPDYVFASRPISDLCKFCQKLIPAIQQFEVLIDRLEVPHGNTKRSSNSIPRDDIASDIDPDNNLEADRRSGTKALRDIVDNGGFQDTADEEMTAESGDQTRTAGSLQGVSYYSGLWEKTLDASHHEDLIALRESAVAGCALCATFIRTVVLNLRRAEKEGDEEYLFQQAAERRSQRSAISPGVVSLTKFKGDSFLNVNLMFADRELPQRNVLLNVHASWDRNLSNGMPSSDPFYRPKHHISLSAIKRISRTMWQHSLARAQAWKAPTRTDDSRARKIATTLSQVTDGGGRIRASNNTRDGLPLLKQWLQKCCTQHQACTQIDMKVAPTRLVYVGGVTPRLCITNASIKYQRYASLSHCWGATHFLTLTKGNVEEFQVQIPPEALSKTFKDAIEITQQLEIDYIWIDSLCIIQNDADDWRKESALMSRVYGGSTINIAASAARDGNGGCFSQRPESWNCRIAVGNKAGENLNLVHQNLYSSDFRHMPLLHRAWTLQERLLPPRTVHFTRTQLYWECHQTTACEMFPCGGIPHNYTTSKLFLQKQPIQASMWQSVIRLYSQCDLTHHSDKLTAISGLARAIQQQSGDSYLAGLWREDMELQLCWRGKRTSFRYETYTAPSWSWASIHEEVETNILQYDIESPESIVHVGVQVLTVDVTPVGKDPFGAVNYGRLSLKCDRVVQAVIVGPRKLQMGSKLIQLLESHLTACSFDGQPPLFGVPICLVPVALVLGGQYRFIAGLILQSTAKQQGQYRRVGIFEIDSKDVEAFEILAMKPGNCATDDWECQTTCQDTGGNAEHIIEIV